MRFWHRLIMIKEFDPEKFVFKSKRSRLVCWHWEKCISSLCLSLNKYLCLCLCLYFFCISKYRLYLFYGCIRIYVCFIFIVLASFFLFSPGFHRFSPMAGWWCIALGSQAESLLQTEPNLTFNQPLVQPICICISAARIYMDFRWLWWV